MAFLFARLLPLLRSFMSHAEARRVLDKKKTPDESGAFCLLPSGSYIRTAQSLF
jgi:hypothetical protein